MECSNTLSKKQLEKMSNDQLIHFAMKVQEDVISKQNALSNKNKELNSELHHADIKID